MPKKDLLLFVILLLIAVIAITYYFYKAAFRFDPYYQARIYIAEKSIQ